MGAGMKLAPETRVALDKLHIPLTLIESRRLREYREAKGLMIAERGADGRKHRLAPEAAEAWRALQQAAAQDQVRISIVSAFRSVSRQVELIEAKLAKGQPLHEVLSVLAPPGFSEHHTGRAIDVGTANCPPADEVFRSTRAFGWLVDQGAEFGFTLSFPRNNTFGYQYEPWHWRYR